MRKKNLYLKLFLGVIFIFLSFMLLKLKTPESYFIFTALIEGVVLIFVWLDMSPFSVLYFIISAIVFLIVRLKSPYHFIAYLNLLVFGFIGYLVYYFYNNVKNEVLVNQDFISEEKARYESNVKEYALLEKKQTSLELQIKNLENLSELLNETISLQDVNNIVNIVLKKTAEIFPNSVVVYSEKKIEKNMFETVAGINIDESVIGKSIDSFGNLVFDNKLPLLIEDMDLYVGKTGERFFLQDYKSIMLVPVFLHHDNFAIIGCYKKGKKQFETNDIRLLQYIGDTLSAILVNIALYEEIERLAKIDGITGLYVQRALVERMKQEMYRAKKHGSTFSLLIVDIDNFKSFNDSYGHQIGDLVLVKLAETIKTSIRKNDFPCRYGGDEFFIILPETKINGAVVLAERIRQRIIEQTASIKCDDGRSIHSITVSVGVGEYKSQYKDYKDFVQVVDGLLYKAKKKGKNCIVSEDAK